MKINNKLHLTKRTLIIVILTILFVYPFWWMLVNSLNNANEIFGKPSILPRSWVFYNYVEIFKIQPFGRHYANTLLVAFVGTLGNIIFSSMSGYSFAKLKFPGRNLLFIVLLTALMMPIEVIIIPLYSQMMELNLSDSLIPLMLIPIFCAQGAFSSFMFRQHFITIPNELEEAAKLDGLSAFGIFKTIMLPISTPIIAAAGILAFLSIWNMYLEPLVFINSLNNFTLPLSLANFNDSYGLPQWQYQLAATSLSIIPIMGVYLIFQEKITDAMVGSGMK
ncbi:MAG: carbohydrate ABC transporter permease [Spirochaetaceae bacterium]|nr:carbohydrate ABC transporter permease [Spirochaetaceae bacterium]